MATTIRFQLRGDSAENWESKNPVLLKNEPAYDQTNNRLKLGDGVHAWNELDYLAPEVVNDLVSGGVLKALSAEQGKILKELVDKKADSSELNKVTNNFSEEIQKINQTLEGKLDADKVAHETWIFTLEDESTVEKEVVLWNS